MRIRHTDATAQACGHVFIFRNIMPDSLHQGAFDITDIDMNLLAANISLIEKRDYDVDTKNILYDKLKFRESFAEDLGLIRLNYMFTVLRAMYHGKT